MEADVDFPADKSDINNNYIMFLNSLKTAKKVEVKPPSQSTIQDDYFRNFRTKTLLIWIFTNAILVVLMTNDALLKTIYNSINYVPANDFNPYLKVINF